MRAAAEVWAGRPTKLTAATPADNKQRFMMMQKSWRDFRCMLMVVKGTQGEDVTVHETRFKQQLLHGIAWLCAFTCRLPLMLLPPPMLVPPCGGLAAKFDWSSTALAS